jgi:GTP-binding protein Era
VREQLLQVAREELPHSIAVTVEEMDDDPAHPPRDDLLRLSVTIRVERDSQKGIVIGRGGEVLKTACSNARRELEALLGTRIHMDTRVRVDRDWQRRPQALDRLGFDGS